MSNKKVLDRLWKTRPHICHWCDTELDRLPAHGSLTPPGTKIPPDAATVDHIVPKVWDGSDEDHNTVLACNHCNLMRAAAGHCMAALDCALDVLGAGAQIGSVMRFYEAFHLDQMTQATIARQQDRAWKLHARWSDPAPQSALAVALSAELTPIYLPHSMASSGALHQKRSWTSLQVHRHGMEGWEQRSMTGDTRRAYHPSELPEHLKEAIIEAKHPAPEIRRNEDGSLDEIVASECEFHLEQMCAGQWWMSIRAGGVDTHVTLYTEEDSSAILANVIDNAG